MSSQRNRNFAIRLVEWGNQNQRNLPWVGEKDPYKIWISEIMLQQTRADQALPYYLRFMQRFPTVKRLATAGEEEVLKFWEGLGYYSRARNLHKAARMIVAQYDGVFPENYEDIRALPGIGDYTAAAISSFAFGEHRAAMDGNAFRILSRHFGIFSHPSTAPGRKPFAEQAGEIIRGVPPGLFNQAMMDLGATICTPRNPTCTKCPLVKGCYAFSRDLTCELPVAKAKTATKNRHLHYFFIIDPAGKTLIRKREEQDIWRGLFEFVLLETEHESAVSTQKIRSFLKQIGVVSSFIGETRDAIKHLLTHRTLYLRFYHISLKSPLESKNYSGYKAESVKNLLNFAFPRPVRVYLNNKFSK